MKHIAQIALALALAAVATGCSTTPVDANKWADAYYNQANTANIMQIEGSNVCLNMSGVSKFTLSTPVAPKQMMPQSPGFWDGVGETVRTSAMIIAPWYFLTRGGGASFNSDPRRAINPTIQLPARTPTPATP
jgi:hypothetical protein